MNGDGRAGITTGSVAAGQGAARALRPADLQATYDPRSAQLGFWGGENPDVTLRSLGLPVGHPGALALALPAGLTRGEVVGTRMPARLVGVEEALESLAGLKTHDDEEPGPVAARTRAATAGDQDPRIGDSVHAWAEAVALLRSGAGDEEFRRLAERMPIAAHAALRPDQTSIDPAVTVLEKFRATALAIRCDPRPEVRAQLRHYQREGVVWLAGLEAGGILADEMGLGKTLQAISLLSLRRGDRPHLVVCPTSLLGTWERELARFAPQLPTLGFHGSGRLLDRLAPGTVVLTSYGVLRTEADRLTAREWDLLVLDEAQQVKNPRTKAAQAAKRLTARVRLAMTGTPVENRLEDLWSILSLTNPGLLGTRSRFRSRFVVPIEQRRSRAAADRLAELVTPHVLRRTKLEVAPELAPKQEVPVYCSLTAEQTGLYRHTVDQAFREGLGSGIGRRGRVLALLTRLKQICNHPAQLLGEDGPLPGRSGKLDRTGEIVAELAASGERALVFTQYRQMGELLVAHLDGVLGGRGIPFLHGGLTGRQRDSMVVEFQESPRAAPVMVVSLRAAGFGLTLTRASSVIHYDRWWNPAVEDQASDRVHRIGQERPVTVYTLVTAGTVEDHIARIQEEKRGVAAVIAEGGEARLAALDDRVLREVLDLAVPGSAP